MATRAPRRRRAIHLTAAVAMTLAGCSGEEATSSDSTSGPGTTISVADPAASGALEYEAFDDASSQIHVALGRRFALQLDSEPGAGYSWQVANTPDPAVVVPLGTQLRSRNPGLPGSTADQYISFAASGEGTTTIEVHYVSPTGEVAPDTAPLVFTVTVTLTGEPPPPPAPETTAPSN